ncbi:unnamed protein product, partial [Adineta steineri]
NKILAYARLVFMPVSKDYTIRNIESGQTKCDSREEMSHEDFFLYVKYFNQLPVQSTEFSWSINRYFFVFRIAIETFKLVDIISGDKDATNNLLNLFRDDQQVFLNLNDYAEVEFHQTQTYISSMLTFGECKPMRLLPKLIDNPQIKVRTTRFRKSINYRRGRAITHYHSFYNPHCLFELEIRWLVASLCILGDLITQWLQCTGIILGSNQVAFHLVLTPRDPFAEFDALRGIVFIFNIRFKSTKISSIYIKINLLCLHDKLANISDKDQILRINIFQELILKRGVMLVYIISNVYSVHYNNRSTCVVSTGISSDDQSFLLDYGFLLVLEFLFRKRWRSSQTDEEKYQDIMLADFRAFCAIDNNRLVNFCNVLNNLANEKINEK